MRLLDIYSTILKEESNWNPTRSYEIEHDIQSVFNYPNSYNFIFELLWYDGNYHSLVNFICKFNANIPKNRYSHTVSLYLLGVILAREIGYDKFSLPQWDGDNQRNFLHHWAAICLFHDIGYFIENNPKDYPPNQFRSIHCLYEKLQISYKITDIDQTGLILKYYNYRVCKMEKVDHGIVSAVLLYDDLMKRNNKMKELSKTALMISEKPMYGTVNESSIKEYALTIAKHNMWFADSIHYDEYEKEGLSQLLPKEDLSHRIDINKTPVLFLLCLLDTIEPLKACGCSKTPQDVLEAIDLSIEKSDSLVIDIKYCQDNVETKLKSLSDWMNVDIKENRIVINYNLRG